VVRNISTRTGEADKALVSSQEHRKDKAMTELDPYRQDLKERFIKARGFWSPDWDPVLALAPSYFEAYTQYSAVPWATGTLEPKVKELIYTAIDASCTHLHTNGLHTHIRNALRYGATKEEIVEVYELTSVLGIHSLSVGVPALLKVARDSGNAIDLPPLTEAQEATRATFIKNRGYWNELWENVLKLSPQFFEAYSNLSSVPWLTGTLEPKTRELIYLAVSAAPTHLFAPSIESHIANALELGVTVGQIMEVLEMVSVLGIHTFTVGMPVLMEELELAGVSMED
jgi:alkylhydroperoxidase/carboxymuconolactone decarboxylase family protein YurZ